MRILATPPRPKRIVVVMAKAPVAGQVKTRLCPPCTPVAAASLARAALLDTLTAIDVADLDVVVALDQPVSDPSIGRRPTIAQGPGDLGARLQRCIRKVFDAHHDVAGTRVLAVGADTPQLLPAHLHAAFDALDSSEAVIGPAVDGGYWCIGFRSSPCDVFTSVPMSTPRTYRDQLAALQAAGLSVTEVETLRDVDTFDDAIAVAEAAPWTRVARLIAGDRWWAALDDRSASGGVGSLRSTARP